MNAAKKISESYKSPELTKAFSDFFTSWPSSVLKAKLLVLFSYAAKGGMEGCEGFSQDIALLFDQLINLVAAAETLHQASGAPLDNNRQKGEAHE